MRKTSNAIALGVVFATSLLASGASAKSEKPISGKAVAEMVCSRCHEVTNRTIPGRSAGDGSPPAFIQISQDPKMTPEALYQFLRFPHGAMDFLFVTQREVNSLIAYIKSLEPPADRAEKPR